MPQQALLLGAAFCLVVFSLWFLSNVPLLASLPSVPWEYSLFSAFLAALVFTYRWKNVPFPSRLVLALASWAYVLSVAALIFLLNVRSPLESALGRPLASSPEALRAWLPVVGHTVASAALLFHARMQGKGKELLQPRLLTRWVPWLLLLPLLVPVGMVLPIPAPPQAPHFQSPQEILPFFLSTVAFVFLLWKGTWMKDLFENGMVWFAFLQQAAIGYILFSFGAEENMVFISTLLWFVSFFIPPSLVAWKMLVLYRTADRRAAGEARAQSEQDILGNLALSSSLFRGIVQQSLEPFYIVNEKGITVFANDAFLAMANRTEADILGHAPDEWSKPVQDGRSVSQLLEQAAIRKIPQGGAIALLEGTGNPLRVILNVTPHLDEFGEARLSVVHAQNYSQANEEVLLLRQILDNMPLGICLLELPSLRILHRNGTATGLLARARLHSLDTLADLHRLFQTEDGHPYPEENIPAAETMRTSEGAKRDDIVIPLEGARMVWQMQSTPIFDAQGHLHQILLSFDDITERKAVEHDMTDYVSIIAHQLRTPLTAMKWSLVQLQKYAAMPPADVQTLLQTSAESAERMFRIVQGILQVAKVEHKQMELHMEEVDVPALLNRALATLQSQIAAKKICFKQSILHAIPPIRSDAILLQQVFQNLLENAAKYTPPSGEIDSILSLEKESILWTIHDNGIGIPKNLLPRLFEKFLRGENAQKAEAYGLGLGLYTVRLILTILGGKVTCESEQNKGTTFRVSIPLAVPA